MKIRIELKATEASPAVHALAGMADDLEGVLLAAVAPLVALVEVEDFRTEVLCAVVGTLESEGILDGEVESAESEDGEDLDSSLEGELSLELEEAISSRREAKDVGHALLGLLARLSHLELTEVAAKLGRRTATLEQVAAAIIERAREYGVELRAPDEDGLGDEDDVDDDTDFADSDQDDEDDDTEDEDEDAEDDAETVDDDGFPAGGWGSAADASSARRVQLSPDEQLYLQVAELTWPCSVADVRARLRRALAKRHPDPVRCWNPTLADRYEEEYKRLQLGHDALLARCGAGGRAC